MCSKSFGGARPTTAYVRPASDQITAFWPRRETSRSSCGSNPPRAVQHVDRQRLPSPLVHDVRRRAMRRHAPPHVEELELLDGRARWHADQPPVRLLPEAARDDGIDLGVCRRELEALDVIERELRRQRLDAAVQRREEHRGDREDDGSGERKRDPPVERRSIGWVRTCGARPARIRRPRSACGGAEAPASRAHAAARGAVLAPPLPPRPGAGSPGTRPGAPEAAPDPRVRPRCRRRRRAAARPRCTRTCLAPCSFRHLKLDRGASPRRTPESPGVP